jgi:uncharacterized protein (DUF1015 family)
MVDFRPFRAIRYSPSAGNLADLICPPYDVISPGQERRLLAKDPNNMVRLELAELSGPAPAGRYQSAAKEFERMQREGVLKQDETPSYYLLRQRFTSGGVQRERLGLFGALKAEEPGEHVLPHEDTAAGPKEDRLALMKATLANFSPIMMLYRDADGSVASVVRKATAKQPDADFSLDGDGYSLWRIADSDAVRVVHDALASQPTYIADGHHRYETAVGYSKTNPSADTVLTCLISFDDPGLLIQPYYRVVHGLDDTTLALLKDRMAKLFKAAPVKGATPDDLDKRVAEEGAKGVVLGVVQAGEEPSLLTPADSAVPTPDRGASPNEQAKAVEANVLQELLFKPIIGASFPQHVAYVHDPEEAFRMVHDGEGQIAFFIKGVPADVFEAVVGAGIRLPRKSTYFHPKLPSGLVINPLF